MIQQISSSQPLVANQPDQSNPIGYGYVGLDAFALTAGGYAFASTQFELDGDYERRFDRFLILDESKSVVGEQLDTAGLQATGKQLQSVLAPVWQELSNSDEMIGLRSGVSWIRGWDVDRQAGPVWFDRRLTEPGMTLSERLSTSADFLVADFGLVKLLDNSFVAGWASQTQHGREDTVRGRNAIVLQRFDQNGERLADPIVIDASGTNYQNYAGIDMLALDDGSFLVAWNLGIPNADVHVQRFDAAARALGPTMLLATSNSGFQSDPTLLLEQDGTILAAWWSRSTTAGVTPSLVTRAFTLNDLPSGTLSLSGTLRQGDVLTLDTAAITDGDGIIPGSVRIDWLRDGVAIEGASGPEYRLTEADVATRITGRLTYTDGLGIEEQVSLTADTSVENVNDAPEGTLRILGDSVDFGTLRADLSDLRDADGLPSAGIALQWLRDGVPIDGATGDILTLGQDDSGRSIALEARWVDGRGTAEVVQAAAVRPATLPPGLTATVQGSTSEAGGTAALVLRLDAMPAAPVTIRITSLDPGEGSPDLPEVTFTPENWGRPVAVTLRGVDDYLDDGDIAYAIQLLPLTNDPAWALPLITVEVINRDDGRDRGREITGTGQSDTLRGIDGPDRLYGEGGRDLLLGGIGNDRLYGGTGDDTLQGGAGDDELYGAEDDDHLTGGDGADTLFGDAGSDRLDGGPGADMMVGGLGNDRYRVDDPGDLVSGEVGWSQGGGIDTVEAWISYTLPRNVEILRLQGTDNLNGTGGAAPEALVGNTGANDLRGNGGNDVLNGKAGDDTLIGGAGADSLVGEGGADVFVFTAVADSRPGQANRDFINGFERGIDRIDLSLIDANSGTGDNDAFTFIGSAAFSGVAGQLRFFTFGGGNFNIVEADVNGDRVADMQIFVNLTNVMVGADFVL